MYMLNETWIFYQEISGIVVFHYNTIRISLLAVIQLKLYKM